jgi:hypothetical protein
LPQSAQIGRFLASQAPSIKKISRLPPSALSDLLWEENGPHLTTKTSAPHIAYLPCMGIGSSGHPRIPAPNLTDIGRGRFGRFRRVAVLERHDGTAWTVMGRYGSIRDANVALDDAVGAGADPDSMRVVEAHSSATKSRALAIVGVLVLCLAIAIILLYVLTG